MKKQRITMIMDSRASWESHPMPLGVMAELILAHVCGQGHTPQYPKNIEIDRKLLRNYVNYSLISGKYQHLRRI